MFGTLTSFPGLCFFMQSFLWHALCLSFRLLVVLACILEISFLQMLEIRKILFVSVGGLKQTACDPVLGLLGRGGVGGVGSRP